MLYLRAQMGFKLINIDAENCQESISDVFRMFWALLPWLIPQFVNPRLLFSLIETKPCWLSIILWYIYKKTSDLCCLEVWMENGAAESGTGLLRPFGTCRDLFNSAILLKSSPGKWSFGWVCYRDTERNFPLWPNTQFLVWPHGWSLFVLETSVDV